jgi:hypothetical protein
VATPLSSPVLPGLLPLALKGDFVPGDGAYHTKAPAGARGVLDAL